MLYTKECKKIARSIVYWIYCAIIVLFICSQYFEEKMVYEPQPDWADYGITYVDDPDIIIPLATETLINDYLNNEYNTYPVGFLHIVHLNSSDKDKMCMICEKITGMSDTELRNTLGFIDTTDVMHYDHPDYNVASRLSYDEFKALMEEADKLLGGGSQFAPEQLRQEFGGVPKTYEQAIAEYAAFAKEDRFSNGYARLFCDYSGIFLSLLPVFVVAALCTMDKRNRMDQLIYARKMSSAKIVISRYTALVTMLMIPVIFMAAWAYIKIALFYTVGEIDNLAFLKYTFAWLLPTIIAATGIGMLLTELFSGIVAVFAQFVWWFVSVMTTPIAGKISTYGFVIRHNTIGERDVFMSQMHQFTMNRLFFTALGFACALFAMYIYHLKRGGLLGENRKSKKMLRNQSQN